MNDDANSITGSDFLDGVNRHAAGAVGALSMLVDVVLMLPDMPKREALVAAEAYATMAACTGTVEGRAKLAAVKFLRFEDFKADKPELAEGYWWGAAELMYPLALAGDVPAASLLLDGLTARADTGDEDAGMMFNELVQLLPPATLAGARRIKEEAKATA